jgi:hypothetical protein
MSTSLVLSIEQLLAFVSELRPARDGGLLVKGAKVDELRQLDVDFFAACDAERISLPYIPPPPNIPSWPPISGALVLPRKPFGSCKIDCWIGQGYLILWPSLEWEQAMISLLALARRRHQSPEKIGTAERFSGEGAEQQSSGEEPIDGTGAQVTEEEDSDDLSDRQRSILETMIEHEITSERRRKKRADIVKLINRTHNTATYGRDFAKLVKRQYLKSREGNGAGVWIIPTKKTEIRCLLDDQSPEHPTVT